jgi:hypothetical protein
MGVAVLEGRIYALGGQFGSVDLADAAVYTPDAGAGRWDELPPLRVARNHLAAAAVAGTVIAISGRSALGLRAEVERYDFAAGAWVLARPIPTARGGSAAAAIGARVFVFGGEGNTGVAGGIFPQTEVYDAGTDQWEARADMSVPRHGIGAAVVGDRILLPGGGPVQGFGVTAAHTAYLPASSDLPSFRRGDASGDGVLDIGDALMMLRALFEGTALVCADAADTDDDGTLAIADAVRLLEFLFLGGPAPAPPFPGLDGDPTPDGLDCVSAGAAPEGR